MATPVVSALFTRLEFGQTIALSDMFDFTDPEGDPIAQVTVSDSNFGVGQFFVNGVAQAEGATFTVNAADLPNTFYQAGFFVGGESFTVSASDGSSFSLPSTNTIRVGNLAPQVTAFPSVVGINQQIAFFDMIRVTDAEMDEIIEYRVRDNGAAQASGRFILDGNVLPALEWHELTPAQASRLVYEGGSVTSSERFSVTVDDGIRSAVSGNQVSTGNSRPEVRPNNNINVLEEERILLSETFRVFDADNNAVQRYFIVDRSNNPNSGFLELNGERLASATFHSLTPGQFSQLEYVGATSGPTFENIGVQVFDGFALSETVDFRINTTSPAVIEPTDRTSVLVNERVNAATLFNAFDPDGGEIREYFFVDRRSNANGGFFELRGQRLPSAVWFNIDASELPDLFYVGASSGPDLERIGIQANDGRWSQPVDISILTDVRPTLTVQDGSILEAYLLDVAPLVSASDSNGNPAEAFRFTDLSTNANGGFFEFRGNRLPSGQFFEVAAADLNDLQYRGGAFGEQSEQVRVQAIAGGILSDPEFLTLTTLENQFRPTVNAFDVTTRVGNVINFATMFTWDDLDGVPPTELSEVRFFDTGTAPDSGFFTINGVQQDAGVWIAVDYDLVLAGAVQYHASARSDNELYRVTVNDGRFVSALDTGRIQAVTTPVLEASQNDFSVDTIERVQLGNFISQTDLGPPVTEFQVLDENTDFRSGRLELDGVSLRQGVVHTLSAAEFDRLVFLGAETDFGRQIDGVLVRGANSVGLTSEWTRFNVNTDPIGTASLETPFQIVNTTATPITEITFSFIDGGIAQTSTRENPLLPLPSYYPAGVDCSNGIQPGVEALGTVAWNQPQREAARAVLESIAQYANIEFREVAFESDGAAGSSAQITFGSWQHDCGSPSYAYSPADGSGLGNAFADIWFDWQVPGWDSTQFDPTTGEPSTVQGNGTAFNFNLLQTIGVAIGLDAAVNELSIFNNFNYNTVQSPNSFNGNSQFDQAFPELPSTFQLYDVARLQEIYGARTDFNTGNTQIRFDDANQVAIYDSAGIDTLNLTQHVVDTTVDLREGQRSTLEDRGVDGAGNPTFTAFDNAVLIPYGVVIENARTGSGNDTLGGNEVSNLLIANDGDDVLIGRGGNDSLRGGDGADTYIWNLGDGRDNILDIDLNVSADSGSREVDRLEIRVRTGELDLLQDDLLFRRLGNNLRIDLTLDRGAAQGSIVIRDYANLANQVETLAIFGPSAAGGADEQIGDDIDLTSIFAASETLGRRFEVTNVDGAFGRIATPI